MLALQPEAHMVGMIRALACVFLLAAMWPAAAHPPTQLNVDGEKGVALEITEFRRLFAEAVAKKDAAALRAMYAETYQHTHTSGKIDGRDTRIVSLLAADGNLQYPGEIAVKINSQLPCVRAWRQHDLVDHRANDLR